MFRLSYYDKFKWIAHQLWHARSVYGCAASTTRQLCPCQRRERLWVLG